MPQFILAYAKKWEDVKTTKGSEFGDSSNHDSWRQYFYTPGNIQDNKREKKVGERDAEIDRSKNKIKERVMIKTADVWVREGMEQRWDKGGKVAGKRREGWQTLSLSHALCGVEEHSLARHGKHIKRHNHNKPQAAWRTHINTHNSSALSPSCSLFTSNTATRRGFPLWLTAWEKPLRATGRGKP